MNYADLENKFGMVYARDYPSTTAQTATNYGYLFCCPFPIEILSITEKHDVAGTHGSPVTLDVLRVPNGTTLASGTTMLASTFSLKSTADTAVTKSGLDLTSQRGLAANDSVAVAVSGTMDAVAGVHITIYYKPTGRGQFR